MNKRVITLLVLFATTALTTTFVSIPLGGVGYFNLSDIAVVFSGLFIAHFLGSNNWKMLLSAVLVTGLGTAAADIYLGWAFFAPATLIAKGLEAGCAYLSYNKKGIVHFLYLLLGGLLMVSTYFVFEIFFLGEEGGLKYALSELFPANTIQLVGGIIGGRIIFMISQKIMKAD